MYTPIVMNISTYNGKPKPNLSAIEFLTTGVKKIIIKNGIFEKRVQ